MATKKAAKKPTADVATGEATTYKVLRPVKHDGDDYLPGDSIDLTPDHAGHLLATKAIEVDAVAAAVAAALAPAVEPAA
jgi:hypothetical protein